MPLALALALVPMPLAAQTPNWVEGPRTVSLGRVAELDLAEGYLFLGAKDAQALLERMGNVPDGSELGLVTSAAEGENWFVIFENRDVGFVKDDDKDEIDADAILAGISEATEESNEIRKEKGVPAIHVAGWEEPPSYDPLTHNLTWALLGRDDDGEETVNFNVRLLGRKGYVSVTLVEDAQLIGAARPHLAHIVDSFSYKSGNKYSEFVPGDKVAEYGLIALLAGGAGAAAAKTGLLAAFLKILAKGGKAVIALVIAAVAGVGRLLRALFSTEREA